MQNIELLKKTFEKMKKSCWQWVADAVLLKSSRQASEVRKGHEHWKLHSVEIWVIDCLGWNAEGSKYESRNMYNLNWYMHSFRQFLNHNSNNSGFEFWRMPSVNEFKNQTDYSSESSVIQFLLRVWSWLRMNAGGVFNTCKSSEKLLSWFFGWNRGVESGGRVSNA